MGHKILLADDSITIQKVIELTFSDEDFELHTVGNGQKAIDEIRSIQPDIVLCDIIMPEKNGYEVCEFIKSNDELKHIPVLLLTGAFEPFDQERAKAAGCEGFLAKPVRAPDVDFQGQRAFGKCPRRTCWRCSSSATPRDASGASSTGAGHGGAKRRTHGGRRGRHRDGSASDDGSAARRRRASSTRDADRAPGRPVARPRRGVRGRSGRARARHGAGRSHRASRRERRLGITGNAARCFRRYLE